MKSDLYLKSLLLIIAVFLGIIALRPFLQTDLATAAKSVEYRAVRSKRLTVPSLQKALDKAIKDGWELVDHYDYILIFKK